MDMFGRGTRWAAALALLALVTAGAARAADDGPPKKAASLGLATQRLSDTWREKNAYKASGVLVIGVDPSGRAAKGGISTGDVLVSVDGRTLREPSDLGYAERTFHADQPVAVVLARDGGRSIKMFDIAPLSDAGPSPSAAAMGTGIAVEPVSPAAAAPDPTAAPEPTGSSVIIDTAPAAGALAAGADAGGGNSIEPTATLIIARADTSGAPGAAAASGKTGAAELGVRGQALTPDLATALGAEGAEGVLVLEVSKESPADHAGLRAGDIIFKIGEEPVKDPETLDAAVVAATNPAAINMLRRGDQQMVLAPLDGHPAPANDAPAVESEEQEQVITELKGEVASLKKELADLKAQIAKLMQDSAKPKP